MYLLNLKTSYKPVIEYYEALDKFNHLGVKHEGAVRSAFQTLLESCSKQFNWTLVPEYQKNDRGKEFLLTAHWLTNTKFQPINAPELQTIRTAMTSQHYISRLIKKIVTVSLETSKIVKSLPML